MKIVVLGWYGTETIGDRAILAGLISFFRKSFGDFEVHLGSLYPFFSERTINEDYGFYKELVCKDFIIEIFNSKDSTQLTQAIKNSDLLVMGGGPLMDLDVLFMVEYAFKKAKKLGKKTALLGCGIGPLFQEKYRKSVFEIAKHSDQIILRDSVSKRHLEAIFDSFNQKGCMNFVNVSYDPAVECAIQFADLTVRNIRGDYIAVNLREFPDEYSQSYQTSEIHKSLKSFVENLAGKFEDHEIKLVPMHYFHVGGDDRTILNDIAQELELKNLSVQNVNLSLKETMGVFQEAHFNVGMRFHSVVLQTILSGYNYVLDYTEPGSGKISGFLGDFDNDSFYEKRYLSLQRDFLSVAFIDDVDACFQIDRIGIEQRLSAYIQVLNQLSK